MSEAKPLSELATEQANPASAGIDALETEAVLDIINAEDRKVADAVAAEIPNIAKAVDALVEAFRAGGRLFYLGAGTSGRLGVLDASECPPTFNVPREMVQGIIAGGDAALVRAAEQSEDDAEAGARDLRARGFQTKDVLVGIAASGRTPYVLGAVEAARAMGARTIGVSCTPDSELSRAAEIAIEPVPGPEVLTGSTRMKAGTATKLVLNMLTTASMIRLGHVYGNLMVNVQPKCGKLRDRALRIVERAAAVDRESAVKLLEAAGGDVKTAILMSKTGAGREEAAARLARAGGRLSEALRNG